MYRTEQLVGRTEQYVARTYTRKQGTRAKPLTAAFLPDHTQLPETDGTFVKNYQEHPQSLLLTDAIEPVLHQLHPDGTYSIGQDSGIYYRLTAPYLSGVISPDWFYVPGVPPLLQGEFRRSYVLWQEFALPVIAIEFVSGDGREERDSTPYRGKFWVYERAIGVPYYAIFDGWRSRLDVYALQAGSYIPIPSNVSGLHPLSLMEVSLGLWFGTYRGMTTTWLRWWDSAGKVLPTSDERAEQERERAEQERERAEQERERAEQERERAEQERERAQQERERAEQECERAERLAAKLREMGIDPDTLD